MSFFSLNKNCIICFILNKFKEKLDFELPFLFLYVDDICTCVPTDRIDQCLNILNSLDDSIKFTCEKENNGSLPFLDLLLIKDEDNILIDLYKKPIASNRILNFKSHHPLQQKISIIKQLKNKIFSLCSTQFRETNIQKMKAQLKSNNYPLKLVNTILNTNPYQYRETEDLNKRKFIKIPFHKKLAPKMKNLFNYPEAKIAFYNTKTNKKFFNKNIKDKTDKHRQSNVVYEIPCSCNKVYIGQTSQYLKKRLSDHRGDIKRGEENTGLSSHVINSNFTHNMQWDKVKILAKEPNLEKRSYLESFHIASNKNNINTQLDFKKCNAIYKNVLNKFK